MNIRIKLKNVNDLINVEEVSRPELIKIKATSIEAVDNVRELLTKDNLSEIQFLTETGDVLSIYNHYEHEKVEYTKEGEYYYASFYNRKLSDIEVRLDALESGQDTQDGAIEELAGIIGGE